ncbi:RNA-directed DNA polymerase, eukaryota [Tanacetum coccineum]|uniref:RNA-directed DNA polymerase, eukaryota n=1 Tax=Tanacetum coccineum TaxID=301880 RepID=A0ABQ5BGP2_9ASTR
MNKAGTKLSKLDRFLISEDVTIRLPDVQITALDRLWSDHNPILLYIDKTDFGPTLFKTRRMLPNTSLILVLFCEKFRKLITHFIPMISLQLPI